MELLNGEPLSSYPPCIVFTVAILKHNITTLLSTRFVFLLWYLQFHWQMRYRNLDAGRSLFLLEVCVTLRPNFKFQNFKQVQMREDIHRATHSPNGEFRRCDTLYLSPRLPSGSQSFNHLTANLRAHYHMKRHINLNTNTNLNSNPNANP